MLSNAYFLAKIRFDTAENEPAKNLQNFRIFEKCIFEKWCVHHAQVRMLEAQPKHAPLRGPRGLLASMLPAHGGSMNPIDTD